jgi:hypothetical protein
MYVVTRWPSSPLICISLYSSQCYIDLVSIRVFCRIAERNLADTKVEQSCGMSSATRYHLLKRIYSVYTDNQPHVYRKIIDDVIANVGVDFEEYGMDEAVLIALQAVRRRHHFPRAS